MSSGTNKERIAQNTTSIEEATTKVKGLKTATFQDKTITENGTYTADTDYSGLGTVTVNVEGGSGDVKLFETEEAMQADTNPKEGDLAVVYREETQNWDGSSSISSITFPKTVTLTTAITDSTSIYGSYSGNSYWHISGDISSTSCSINLRRR